LIVSASNADSAAIVKVQPKESIDLGITEDQLYLKSSWRRELEKKVSTYERRRLIDFSYDLQPKQKDGKTPAEAPMAWIACNGALKAARWAFISYPAVLLVSHQQAGKPSS
jgi:hypothetical protein